MNGSVEGRLLYILSFGFLDDVDTPVDEKGIR